MSWFDDREADRPIGSQPTGYGGLQYGSYEEADKSRLPDWKQFTDSETGYVGTPRQVYDRYRAEGRDTTSLMRRLGR